MNGAGGPSPGGGADGAPGGGFNGGPGGVGAANAGGFAANGTPVGPAGFFGNDPVGTFTGGDTNAGQPDSFAGKIGKALDNFANYMGIPGVPPGLAAVAAFGSVFGDGFVGDVNDMGQGAAGIGPSQTSFAKLQEIFKQNPNLRNWQGVQASIGENNPFANSGPSLGQTISNLPNANPLSNYTLGQDFKAGLENRGITAAPLDVVQPMRNAFLRTNQRDGSGAMAAKQPYKQPKRSER